MADACCHGFVNPERALHPSDVGHRNAVLAGKNLADNADVNLYLYAADTTGPPGAHGTLL